VVGCLIEKEITTPDQYPLSLNASHERMQSETNREPVLELTEGRRAAGGRRIDEKAPRQRQIRRVRRARHEV